MMNNQNPQLGYSKRVVVLLDDELRAALDEILLDRQRKFPWVGLDQMAAMRALIRDEYKRIKNGKERD